MATAEQEYLFEQMPIRQAVCRQILPAIASQMIVLLYNLADTYFVGLLNDPVQTAAVTVSYPVTVLLTAISNLFAVGGASLFARSLGEKAAERARAVSAISFWCGAGSAVLFSLLFAGTASPLLRLCGATSETVPAALAYAKWVILLGGIPTILSLLLANLIRAEGQAALAAWGISLGGLLNLVLDPLFILPRFLGLGAEGAGIATALSNLFSAAFFLLLLLHGKKHSLLSLHPKYLREIRLHMRGILAIGFPSALQYALTMVAVAALSKFVSAYDTAAVAGLGIVKKLDQLPLYFSIGVANGLLPLLAYNHAAGNAKRRHEAFSCGAAISFGFSMLCLLCYEAFAPHLVGLFIKDAQTIAYAARFLRLMVTAMPLMALCYPMIIQFQAMGRAKESLVCSILRKGVLDVPLLFLLNGILPLYGCMLVQPLVDGISLAVALRFYRKIRREA